MRKTNKKANQTIYKAFLFVDVLTFLVQYHFAHRKVTYVGKSELRKFMFGNIHFGT